MILKITGQVYKPQNKQELSPPLQNLKSQKKTLGIYQEHWVFLGGINLLNLAYHPDFLMVMK